MKCIQCLNLAVRDPDYVPPVGFDLDTKRYICTNELCQCVFYVVKKEKKDQNQNQRPLIPKLRNDDYRT